MASRKGFVTDNLKYKNHEEDMDVNAAIVRAELNIDLEEDNLKVIGSKSDMWMGMDLRPANRDGHPFPIPGRTGDGDGDGIGGSAPCQWATVG
jgi:hypothetical protein